MKFTLSWLKDHLETEAGLDEICDALSDIGLEVEGVEDPADALGAFRICRVIEATQHPDADRLRVCRVEIWPNGPEAASEEIQVVCGAPNARTGMIGAFAGIGAYIPKWEEEDRKKAGLSDAQAAAKREAGEYSIKKATIRGVDTLGMLCSEAELLISDDHDGVIDLPEDAPLGVRFIDYKGMSDPVIEIAITPNRPDALGVRGVARDLAARGVGTLKPAPVEAVPGVFKSAINVTLGDDVSEKACPLFVGRHIRGVRNGPSPEWLQQRLKAIGLRPINTLVDITNFMTFDRARPLHVFDAGKVQGDIHVRLSKPGESLMALDDKEYTFDEAMTLICDDAGPEGIGGVMGGKASGCSAETTDVFIEAAYFDPVRTAITGRKLKINSDARYRFERGIDPAFTPEGMELATRMVLDLCGGEASEVIVAGAVPDTARSYGLRGDRVKTLVGMDVEAGEQERILTALGFGVTASAGGFDVAVPAWRPDVHGEADLVEEIARIASLSQLESVPLPRRSTGVPKASLTPMQKRVATTRRMLAAQGMNECVTYTFIQAAEAEAFGGGDAARKLENPISSDMSDMRPSPVPGLLAAAARNQAQGTADLALFEIGVGFHGAEPGEEQMIAAGIRTGGTASRDWSGARRPVDFHDVRGDIEAALGALNAPVDRLMIDRAVPDWLHPGRSALFKLGPKNLIAMCGEVHPKVVAQFDLSGPVMAFSIFLEALPMPKAKSPARAVLAMNKLQAVDRDFAFVVDARTEADAICKAAKAAEKNLIETVTVFDVFEGAKAESQLGEGKKSVAISVRLQPKAQSFTDAEIEAIGAKVIASVNTKTGAALRA